MHKIDSQNAVAGQFQDGNPAIGQKATFFTAAWANAVQNELVAVIEAAGISLSKPENTQLLAALRSLLLPKFASGSALPTTDIGPIWHADYQSVMVWTVFNANGASYTGYASVLVGTLLADTQPTPRIGYVKSGVTNLSRSTYAALRGWAMHNGVMVALGTWAAGAIAVADNADGTTFRVFDVRGEFPRYWDDGRGVDSGRAIGTSQGATGFSSAVLRASATGVLNLLYRNVDVANDFLGTRTDYAAVTAGVTRGNDSDLVWINTRPRNTALLAAIHF